MRKINKVTQFTFLQIYKIQDIYYYNFIKRFTILSTLTSIQLSSERYVFLYFSSFHNISKSMAFVSGGLQKHFKSQRFDHHSASSSWSLPNLITCLSIETSRVPLAHQGLRVSSWNIESRHNSHQKFSPESLRDRTPNQDSSCRNNQQENYSTMPSNKIDVKLNIY